MLLMFELSMVKIEGGMMTGLDRVPLGIERGVSRVMEGCLETMARKLMVLTDFETVLRQQKSVSCSLV